MSGGVLAWPVESEPSWPVVHGLQHVERLARAALAHDDAVGAHAQGVAQQVADGDLALPLEVGRARLEAHHVLWRSCSSAASSIVTMRSSSGMKEERTLRKVVLPEPVPPDTKMLRRASHAGLQELEHLGRGRPEADEVGHRVGPRGELADGDHRAHERERLDDGVDARAVGQAGIDPRARLVDAPPERGDDAVDARA